MQGLHTTTMKVCAGKLFILLCVSACAVPAAAHKAGRLGRSDGKADASALADSIRNLFSFGGQAAPPIAVLKPKVPMSLLESGGAVAMAVAPKTQTTTDASPRPPAAAASLTAPPVTAADPASAEVSALLGSALAAGSPTASKAQVAKSAPQSTTKAAKPASKSTAKALMHQEDKTQKVAVKTVAPAAPQVAALSQVDPSSSEISALLSNAVEPETPAGTKATAAAVATKVSEPVKPAVPVAPAAPTLPPHAADPASAEVSAMLASAVEADDTITPKAQTPKTKVTAAKVPSAGPTAHVKPAAAALQAPPRRHAAHSLDEANRVHHALKQAHRSHKQVNRNASRNAARSAAAAADMLKQSLEEQRREAAVGETARTSSLRARRTPATHSDAKRASATSKVHSKHDHKVKKTATKKARVQHKIATQKTASQAKELHVAATGAKPTVAPKLRRSAPEHVVSKPVTKKASVHSASEHPAATKKAAPQVKLPEHTAHQVAKASVHSASEHPAVTMKVAQQVKQPEHISHQVAKAPIHVAPTSSPKVASATAAPSHEKQAPIHVAPTSSPKVASATAAPSHEKQAPIHVAPTSSPKVASATAAPSHEKQAPIHVVPTSSPKAVLSVTAAPSHEKQAPVAVHTAPPATPKNAATEAAASSLEDQVALLKRKLAEDEMLLKKKTEQEHRAATTKNQTMAKKENTPPTAHKVAKMSKATGQVPTEERRALRAQAPPKVASIPHPLNATQQVPPRHHEAVKVEAPNRTLSAAQPVKAAKQAPLEEHPTQKAAKTIETAKPAHLNRAAEAFKPLVKLHNTGSNPSVAKGSNSSVAKDINATGHKVAQNHTTLPKASAPLATKPQPMHSNASKASEPSARKVNSTHSAAPQVVKAPAVTAVGNHSLTIKDVAATKIAVHAVSTEARHNKTDTKKASKHSGKHGRHSRKTRHEVEVMDEAAAEKAAEEVAEQAMEEAAAQTAKEAIAKAVQAVIAHKSSVHMDHQEAPAPVVHKAVPEQNTGAARIDTGLAIPTVWGKPPAGHEQADFDTANVAITSLAHHSDTHSTVSDNKVRATGVQKVSSNEMVPRSNSNSESASNVSVDVQEHAKAQDEGDALSMAGFYGENSVRSEVPKNAPRHDSSMGASIADFWASTAKATQKDQNLLLLAQQTRLSSGHAQPFPWTRAFFHWLWSSPSSSPEEVSKPARASRHIRSASLLDSGSKSRLKPQDIQMTQKATEEEANHFIDIGESFGQLEKQDEMNEEAERRQEFDARAEAQEAKPVSPDAFKNQYHPQVSKLWAGLESQDEQIEESLKDGKPLDNYLRLQANQDETMKILSAESSVEEAPPTQRPVEQLFKHGDQSIGASALHDPWKNMEDQDVQQVENIKRNPNLQMLQLKNRDRSGNN